MNPTTTDGSDAAPLTITTLAERFAAAACAVAAEQGGTDALARALESTATVEFEAPRHAGFGELATNLAFGLAKPLRRPPQAIAEAVIARALTEPAVQAIVADARALAGFINVRLVPSYWHTILATILTQGPAYGRGAPKPERISLEFGSANPTGPLVVVQGRTLSVGDTLARALRFAGWNVFTEWLINDAGSQMDALGRSIYARYRQLADPLFPFPENGYPGEDVIAIATTIHARDGERWHDVEESEAVAAFARIGRDELVDEQRRTAAAFGVTFDLWQSERALHDAGAIEAGIGRLRERGLTFEHDGATWVRTTATGDDEDRVVLRSDGRPTYYAGDVAYHYDKFMRGNERIIDILGPDHHGYIQRLRALAAAYERPEAIEVLLAQQITLRRGAEIVSMSKRAGSIVTLAEIVDEVGVDAARFFFVMLSLEQPLVFDLALARSHSTDNPVYYVQYGHARIAGVLRRAVERDATLLDEARTGARRDLLVDPREIALIRRLADFGAVVENAARQRAVHRIAKYARDVAADFHPFYDACTIVGEDRALSVARLGLCIAAKTVLAQTLTLCGVSAPERMNETPQAKAAP